MSITGALKMKILLLLTRLNVCRYKIKWTLQKNIWLDSLKCFIKEERGFFNVNAV